MRNIFSDRMSMIFRFGVRSALNGSARTVALPVVQRRHERAPERHARLVPIRRA